jgi:DNA/RNA-binding domain of Phe-tRNA-synthetase-like protein
MMRIKLDDDFLRRFPQANIHTLVYDDVGRITPALADRWRARADAHVRSMNLSAELLTAREEIQEWRQAFSQFGLKPSKFRSSIEQLWRRAVQGHLIQTPVSLVNLYCYVSILAGSPMGSYDLDRVSGDICVRLALGGEQFTGIGEQEAVDVPPGVVVYADDSAVLCYGWNHRDAACSALRPDTRRAIFFADSALASSRARAGGAITLLREALDEAGATFLSAEILDAENREAKVAN